MAVTLKEVVAQLTRIETKVDKLLNPRGGAYGIPGSVPVEKPEVILPPEKRDIFLEPGTYFPSGHNPLYNRPFKDKEDFAALLAMVGVKYPAKYLSCADLDKIHAWEQAEKA